MPYIHAIQMGMNDRKSGIDSELFLTLALAAWYFYAKKLIIIDAKKIGITDAEKLGIALPIGSGASRGQEEGFGAP